VTGGGLAGHRERGVIVDAGEPPRIVVEQPAPCADARSAEEVLGRVLQPNVSPRGKWTVLVRVRRDPDALTAEGEITDETGAPVAHRSIRKETRAKDPECAALVRAAGVWASLVLDEELQRAHDNEANAKKNEVSTTNAAPWPAPQSPPPPPPPESSLFLKNPENRRSFEVGAGAAYMYGTLGDTGAAIGGAQIYAIIEVGSGWLLRPTILGGRSLKEVSSSGDIGATWVAGRFDACRRLPGNYIERRGIQMDVCGGAEGGTVALDTDSSRRAVGLLAPGGTLAIRGELASDLAAEVRGLVGVNLIRPKLFDSDSPDRSAVQPLLVYARLEVGLSWRLR
jgi:hypothetical protein